jgi:hypothetical protein
VYQRHPIQEAVLEEVVEVPGEGHGLVGWPNQEAEEESDEATSAYHALSIRGLDGDTVITDGKGCMS